MSNAPRTLKQKLSLRAKENKKMKKLQKTMLIAWAVHFVLLGAYIAGNLAGQALANDLIPQSLIK